MRYLVHIKVKWDDNIWTMKPTTNRGDKQFAFKASEPQFKKLLFRLKAKDSATDPKSVKKRTYQQMINEIKTGKDNMIYVWSEKYPDSLDKVKELMQ